MGLGKFVGAVNISVAMNLEDLGISQDLEISLNPRVPPHKKKVLGSEACEADQWQIEQRRKLSEITFDPRQTGPPTHPATLIKSSKPGENKKMKIAK